VWLLAGAGPMLSAHKAIAVLIIEAVALILWVIFARAVAETLWLMLAFLFAVLSFVTYWGTILKWAPCSCLDRVLSLWELSVATFAVKFVQEQGVHSVTGVDGPLGCPHEEGIDYPEG
jgi:hypothetical protein